MQKELIFLEEKPQNVKEEEEKKNNHPTSHTQTLSSGDN